MQKPSIHPIPDEHRITTRVYLVAPFYGLGYTETVSSKNYRVERPEDPTRAGYEFVCWCFDAQYSDDLSLKTAWLFEAFAVTSDMTLYAYWEPVSGGNTPDTPVNPSDPSDVAVYDGSEVTITFYHTMGSALQSVLNKYIAEFNELYPNITVEHEIVGGYTDLRDQVKMDLAVGNQPNITYCYPEHVALYNLTNKVVPLDNYIASTATVTRADGTTETFGLTNAQIDAFIDGFYQEGTMFDEDGTMYTLPMSKSTEVLYYNKTFFEANGLKVPTTWEEMEAVSAQIAAINPNAYAFAYDSENNWFITLCEQYGSDYTSLGEDHFLFNNETNRAFMKELRTWYDNGYFTTQNLYGAYTSDVFVKGGCYMVIGSNAGAKYYLSSDCEVGIAPIPQVDLNNPKSISQGPSLCMFDQGNKQEVAASWLFVKFLTTNAQFQAEFSMTSGYMPVLEYETMASEVPAYAYWLNYCTDNTKIVADTIKVALAQADAYFVSPAFNGSSVARDQVGYLMQYCLVTQTTNIDAMIAKAFEDAITECEYYS